MKEYKESDYKELKCARCGKKIRGIEFYPDEVAYCSVKCMRGKNEICEKKKTNR